MAEGGSPHRLDLLLHLFRHGRQPPCCSAPCRVGLSHSLPPPAPRPLRASTSWTHRVVVFTTRFLLFFFCRDECCDAAILRYLIFFGLVFTKGRMTKPRKNNQQRAVPHRTCIGGGVHLDGKCTPRWKTNERSTSYTVAMWRARSCSDFSAAWCRALELEIRV